MDVEAGWDAFGSEPKNEQDGSGLAEQLQAEPERSEQYSRKRKHGESRGHNHFERDEKRRYSFINCPKVNVWTGCLMGSSFEPIMTFIPNKLLYIWPPFIHAPNTKHSCLKASFPIAMIVNAITVVHSGPLKSTPPNFCNLFFLTKIILYTILLHFQFAYLHQQGGRIKKHWHATRRFNNETTTVTVDIWRHCCGLCSSTCLYLDSDNFIYALMGAIHL